MDSANPEKQHTRDEVWEAAHLRPDATILPSAIESYEKVKVVQEKRRMSGDAANDDISSDVLTEAFGKDKKRLRGLSNDMSLKQLSNGQIGESKSRNPDLVPSDVRQATSPNLTNMFEHFTRSNSSSNPKVELLSRHGSIVAKGYVATDLPSKICHGKMILASEKGFMLRK